MNQTIQNQSGSPTEDMIRVPNTLLSRAKRGNIAAMKQMFQHFIPEDEKILHTGYFGFRGFWGIGENSFGCLTNKRMSSLTVGPFKQLVYQDGFLEYLNSGVIYQPNKLMLYVLWIFSVVFGIGGVVFCYNYILGFFLYLGFTSPHLFSAFLAILIGTALFVFVAFYATLLFYRIVMSGVVCWVRQGVPVYIFVQRNKMWKANQFYRIWSILREERVKKVEKI